MRASPRTWPSIRLRRLSTDVLASDRMRRIYPYGVTVSRRIYRGQSGTLAKPSDDRDRPGLRHAGRVREDPTPLRAPRTRVLFLLRRMPQQVYCRSEKIS